MLKMKMDNVIINFLIFIFANMLPYMNQKNSKTVQFCVNFFTVSQ